MFLIHFELNCNSFEKLGELPFIDNWNPSPKNEPLAKWISEFRKDSRETFHCTLSFNIVVMKLVNNYIKFIITSLALACCKIKVLTLFKLIFFWGTQAYRIWTNSQIRYWLLHCSSWSLFVAKGTRLKSIFILSLVIWILISFVLNSWQYSWINIYIRYPVFVICIVFAT